MGESWQDNNPADAPPTASGHVGDDEPTRDLTSLAPIPVEERHQTELRSSVHVTATVGAASDVGHRHEVNQDAYRVAVVPAGRRTAAVLVIADGVSSAIDSDIASDQAVAAATRRIVGHLTEVPDNSPDELAEMLAEAFAMANLAVLGGRPGGASPGSCTLIAGVVTADGLTVANVGDSRAYWVGDDDTATRMSIDDSIAQARIDMGVPREEAEAGVHSHAITRWLGPMATDVTPRVLSFSPASAGWLLACSDGLWNYASDPAEIANLVRHATTATTAEAAAQRLVDWALGQGGRDNVTVALARWEPRAQPTA